VVALLALTACTAQPTVLPPTTPTTSPTPPTPTPTAAPTLTPPPTALPIVDISVAHEGAVLHGDDLGEPGHYDATLPAAYFEADGIQHLYVIGFGAEPGDQHVFDATSDDGVSWTIDPQDPFSTLGLDLSPPGPIPASVLPTEDGHWQMYLWGVPAAQTQGSQIYRATADEPGGPWTGDPEPVVPIGHLGDDDDGGLDFPAVVPDGDGYVMLYSANGGDQPNSGRILLARSDNGVTWQKAGRIIDPTVCGGAADFIAIPRLFNEGDGFLALVQIGSDVAAVRSPDAQHWECASDGVAFKATEIPGSDRVHTLAAARVSDGINVLIEALVTLPSGVVGSELWLTEVTGP